MTIPPNPHSEQAEKRFWLIICQPDQVPRLLGPWHINATVGVLRETMKANPAAFINYLKIDTDGTPDVEHGPLVLQYSDHRYSAMKVGSDHNERVAEDANRALGNPPADDGEREALVERIREQKRRSPLPAPDDLLTDCIDAIMGNGKWAALPPQPEGVKHD